MKIVVLGLSITSSWGNGHATTYRSLCRALHSRGHRIVFVEKDVPWYRDHRDLEEPDFCRVILYRDWNEGRVSILSEARDADVVLVGSYFPDAIRAADDLFESISAPVLFYDIDTPITMAALHREDGCAYLRADQIQLFSAYLSFTGGPLLEEIRSVFHARRVFPLCCSVDPQLYRESQRRAEYKCDLSYLGTYAADRQQKLMELCNSPALCLPDDEFLVAGSQYPEIAWAANIRRLEHVAPSEHASLYSSSRYCLNLTRAEMVRAGYSPSVRLFEAAACGAAILSDSWEGLDQFFTPGKEVLLVSSSEDVVDVLIHQSDQERRMLGEAARDRVLSTHTATHRAIEFERICEGLSAERDLGSAKIEVPI